jgi:hypothetical protein
MERDEKWLDGMQVKLSDVCKSSNWGLKQTAVLAVGTRSFLVEHGGKSITVLISNLICTRIEADVKLEYDDIEYDEDQIRTLVAEKLL